MSGLLNLCHSVNNPVDHAAAFTGQKINIKFSEKKVRGPDKKKRKRTEQKKRKKKARKPYFSPLWSSEPPSNCKSKIVKLNEELLRVKLCPQCGDWKGCDTDNFERAKDKKYGLSSWCRCCREEYTRCKNKQQRTQY